MKNERWIKDNVEAIAVAIVMALVIRQFAIEAFAIPTESMAPTLLGNRLGGSGDRILVDKVRYKFKKPQRGDIVVFKYPLNESKNYIKRAIAFGGETLRIIDGDIVINGETWRKPERVQQDLFLEVYPGEGEMRPREPAWDMGEQAWSRVGKDYLVRSPDGESMAVYNHTVTDAQTYDSERPGRGLNDVGDVKVSFEVTPESDGGAVVVRVVDNRVAATLELAIGEGESRVVRGAESHALEGVTLEKGATVEVSFANADDALYAVVDGRRFGPFLYDRPEDFDSDENRVAFGIRGGVARFGEIRLFRDVYYEDSGACRGGREVAIPEDHFFAMGDNSRNSRDSRGWTVNRYVMADGTVYETDTNRDEDDWFVRPGSKPGTIGFTDVKGIPRTIRNADIEEEESSVPRSFVPMENLIGKAFFVFWPMIPRAGQFRIRFLR